MLELQGLQQIYDEVRALGAEIYSIGPETLENARKFIEKGRGAYIPALCDVDGAAMDAYRISFEVPEVLWPFFDSWGLNLPALNPQVGWRLPVPATFVLDPAGVVRARYVNPEYTERMEPADIVAALRAIAGH